MFQHRDCTAWRKGDGKGGFSGHICIGPRRLPVGVVQGTSVNQRTLVVMSGQEVSRWTEGGGGYVSERDLLIGDVEGRNYGSLYDVDGDGQEEFYLVPDLKEGQVLRMATTDWQPCKLGPSPYWNRGNYGLAATELNGDGVVDFVSSRTCAGCTSNHILYTGHP